MTESFHFENRRSLDLICMGRVAVDLYAEQVHSPLEDAQSFRKYLGGCAGNTAVGTARLGPVSYTHLTLPTICSV